jgi:hypothetical protein
MISYWRRIASVCFLPVVAGIVLDGSDAHACGACFHERPPPPPAPPPPNVPPPPPPPNEVDTIVTDHRMAFAMSTTQSVLWDQIRYSGNPKQFAWVLPVKPGTQVQLSTDAWLAALDANTATVIEPPPLPLCSRGISSGDPLFGGGSFGGGVDSPGGSYACPSGGAGGTSEAPAGGGGGCACDSPGRSPGWFGSALPTSNTCASAGGGSGGGGARSGTSQGGIAGGGGSGGTLPSPPRPPPVTVQMQETVGPYEVVIVRASMGDALDAWLITNGFEVPLNIQPILDGYVAQKLDFVAMKLRPGANVSAMRPVRVVEPGADPTLPLRMISAGAGAHVGITLWIISEGRYEPRNFPMATIDFSKLVYDVGEKRSNYAELRAAALSGNVQIDAGAGQRGGEEAGPNADAAVDSAPGSDGATAPADAGAEAQDAAASDADAHPLGDAAAAESGMAMDAAIPVVTGYWLTEFAGPANLGLAINGMTTPTSSATTPGLLSAYAQACVPQTPSDPCDGGGGDSGDANAGEAGEAGNATDAETDAEAGSNALPEAAAPDSAADDAATSAVDAAACAAPVATVCDDPQVAFVGLHPGSIWITRLVADLPFSALGQDLVLQAAPSQSAVDSLHNAQSWVDGDPCTLGSIGTQSEAFTTRLPSLRRELAHPTQSCALGSRGGSNVVGTSAFAGLVALWLARRKRRRI